MGIKYKIKHNKFINNHFTKTTYHYFKELWGEPSKVKPAFNEHINLGFTTDLSKTITLIVPTWEKNSFFGGLSTALSIFNKITSELNYNKKIIVLSGKYDPTTTYQAKGIFATGSKQNLFFVSESKKINISRNEIFMCTFWTTAIVGLNLLKNQKKYFGVKNRSILYLIQDFEPGFYPWSGEFYLAAHTYDQPDEVTAVFNSKILYDYFKLNNYHFSNEIFFDPALNNNLRKYLKLNNSKRKKQILIYGRPSTPRNAFNIIRSALEIWAEQFPQSREWKIISLGETFKPISVKDTSIVSLGKVSLEKYAKEMLHSYAGISLMMSPHPSYPPLEMSTFGVKTITNTFANKDLVGFNSNIISLKDATPENIAKKLTEICEKYNPLKSEIDINQNYVKGNSLTQALVELEKIIKKSVE